MLPESSSFQFIVLSDMTPTLRGRLRASGLHLISTLCVAAMAAAMVFFIWYPWPYSEVSGGVGLFVLVVGVDIVLGPALTLVIFDNRKRRAELWRDMAVVVTMQLAGLAYGVHTVYIARPVVLALEGDRFRAVIAASVVEEELPQAPEDLRTLSLSGPKLVNTRDAGQGDEKFDAIMAAAAGADLGMRPRYWLHWDDKARADARKVGKPVTELLSRRSAQAQAIQKAIARTGRPIEQLIYIPMLARLTDWSVLLDKTTGDPVGFVPADGF
ncbi:TfpX/TfpZ family type IV pilin accessory protein [Roseateles sp.]|uniref:TfpX/TfpZ family type IV pilin accessory protein n=1 Tax=Roseateles sp. TaxID=1971397 RepID=UPI002F406946